MAVRSSSDICFAKLASILRATSMRNYARLYAIIKAYAQLILRIETASTVSNR
jgi:hypothetical protein